MLESRRGNRLSFLQSVQTGCGARPAYCFQCVPAAVSPKATLTAHIRLVSMLRMCAAIPLLLYMFAWCGA
jgi:hypothetical protein